MTYLDANATTPVLPEVLDRADLILEDYGGTGARRGGFGLGAPPKPPRFPGGLRPPRDRLWRGSLGVLGRSPPPGTWKLAACSWDAWASRYMQLGCQAAIG